MIRRTTTQTLAIRRILIYSIVALTLTFGLSGSATAGQVSAPVTPAEQPTLREGQAPATTIHQTADKHAPGEFRLSKERYDKAVAYTQTEYVLYFVSVGWGILVLVLMLRLGIVARLRDFAERTTASRFAQSLIFIPTLLLILALLHLPLSIVGHRQALRYELSIQGWSSWFWDWCKAEFLMVSLLFLLVWVLLFVMRWRPRTWWLYFWFALIPIALFLFFISPWFFDPLFNTFHSLQEKHSALVASIGQLTRRAGVPIPADRMLLMEASAKTNEINAYVTGFGASKRVVVWDTTIQKATPGEVLYIVGHELGHYVLGHVWKGFLFFVVGAFFGLYVAFRLYGWILKRWGRAWGVRGQEDWAALAVLLLIVRLLDFVGTPIGNAFSRMQEHQADVYGLEVTHGLIPHSSEVAAGAFQVLGDVDLADPAPSRFITFWLYSHPPLGERLTFAHIYDPWSQGKEPKFVK